MIKKLFLLTLIANVSFFEAYCQRSSSFDYEESITTGETHQTITNIEIDNSEYLLETRGAEVNVLASKYMLVYCSPFIAALTLYLYLIYFRSYQKKRIQNHIEIFSFLFILYIGLFIFQVKNISERIYIYKYVFSDGFVLKIYDDKIHKLVSSSEDDNKYNAILEIVYYGFDFILLIYFFAASAMIFKLNIKIGDKQSIQPLYYYLNIKNLYTYYRSKYMKL
jgi:hypothetical protein